MMNRNHLASNATANSQSNQAKAGINNQQYQGNQPNLNYYYQNNGQNHVRQPQSTLFEDSPETTTAYGRLLSGGRGGVGASQQLQSLNQYIGGPILQNRTSRDVNSNYKQQQQTYYPQPPMSTYSQYSGSQSITGPNASTSTRPASHNLYSNEYNKREQMMTSLAANSQNTYSKQAQQPMGQRYTTPTPSGTSLSSNLPSKHTNILHHDDVSSIAMMSDTQYEGGPTDDRPTLQQHLPQHQFNNDDIEENNTGSDVEYIIMNLYNKMKNLESKYIDLANFYKQELVKSNKKEKTIISPRSQSQEEEKKGDGLTDRSNHENLSRHSSSNNNQQSPPSSKGGIVKDAFMLASERQIINDLIEEKKKLEEDLKTVIALKGTQNAPKQSLNGKFSEFKSNIPNREQLEFLNSQLNDTLKEVVENIDTVSKRALNYLSGKQNEMYQLATNRQFNFPPQVKNEALGLWYDSKTKLQSLLSDLKTTITQKRSQIEQNMVSSTINSSRKEATSTSFQDLSGNFRQVDEMIKRELASMRKRQDQYMKAVQKLRNSFRFKEGLVKEEQSKMATMIRDMLRVGMQSNQSSSIGFADTSNPTSALSQNQQNSRRGGGGTSALNTSGINERMTSIERGNTSGNQLMSPFEKKIASYQKSAERRKQNEPRSGSRTRPGQFGQHNSNDPYADHSSQQQQVMDSQELRLIRSRLKHLENSFEDFQGKLLVRNQDAKDMDRQVDSIFAEQTKFLSTLDSLIANYQTQSKDPRNKSKTAARDVSPQSTAQSPHFTSQPQKQDPSKMSELIKSNDQIYLELRKANEKYLNQRVENTKLKDEIQILQSQMEQMTRSGMSPNTSTTQDAQRQQIRLKSRPGHHEGVAAGITPPQPLARNPSANSSLMVRENEDLKKRIRELEKECFQLTYYQQEMQRRGMPDPNAREHLEIKSRLDHLCLQVQQFLLAMRRLQRAVNNKDKDIQDLKGEFEKNKKQLELMVKEFREKDEQAKKASQQQQAHNTSLTSGGGLNTMNSADKRERVQTPLGGGQQRGKSQVAGVQTPTQTIQYPTQVSSTQRQNMTTLDPTVHDGNLSGHLLPPKRAQIRPKQQQQNQQFSQRSDLDQPTLTNPDFFSQHNQTIGQNNQTQNEDFNQLLEEIRSLSDEAERLRRDLADSHRQADAERARSRDCEKIVAEYKEAMERLTADNPQLSQLRNILASRELTVQHRPLLNSFGRQNQINQTDNNDEYLSSDFMEAIKHQVAELIAIKEQELDAQMNDLVQRLNEKEDDLQTLKRLFVEKLREIETSFVELSQDMIENEVVQEQANKKLQQKVLQKSIIKSQGMDKSLEQVIIGKIDDSQDDEQLEQLAQLNDQLNDENRELREHVKQLEKELEGNEEMETMRAQFEEIHELNEQMHAEIQALRLDKESDRVAVDLARRNIESLKKDLADETRSKDRVIAQMQSKINEFELALIKKDQQIQNEIAQRAQFEQNYRQTEALIKKLKAEKQLFEDTIDSMRVAERDLQAKVANQEAEIDMINKMRGEVSHTDDSVSQADDQKRIDENPTEAAQHYLRLMTTMQKEYKIMQLQMEKLQHKYDELKESNDELKLEARESAQEVMNMESTIFDLRKINEQLNSEVEKSKNSQIDEKSIKQQLEQVYLEKFAFKDQELADVNTKLSRISQSNIDYKTKCDRLETANSELNNELTEARARIQYIELQLEMSNQDSERDSEKLISTQRQLEERIEQLNVEIAALKESNTSVIHLKDQEIAEIKEVLERLETQKSELVSQQEDRISEIKAQNAELENQYASQIDQLEQERVKLLAQIDLKNKEAKELNDQRDAQIKEQQETIGQLQGQIEEQKTRSKEEGIKLQERIDSFNVQVHQKNSQIDALSVQIEEKDAKINKKKTKIIGYRNQIETQESKIAQAIEQNSQLTKQASEQANEISHLKNQLQTLTQQQADLVKSLTEKQDQQTQDLLAQKASENNQLNGEIVHLQEQICALNQEKEDLISQHAIQIREQGEIRDKLSRQIDESKEQFEAFIAQNKEQIKSFKADFEAKIEEKASLIKKLEKDLEDAKSDNMSSVTQLTSQIDTLKREYQSQLEDQQTQHNEALEELDNMHQSELSSKIEEIETLIQKIEELNSENDKLKVDIEESNKKQSDLVKSLTETQEQQTQELLAKKSLENGQLSATIAAQSDDLSLLKAKVSQLESNLLTAKTSSDDLQVVLNGKILDIKGLNEQCEDLTRIINSQTDEIQSQRSQHQQVLAQKEAQLKEQLEKVTEEVKAHWTQEVDKKTLEVETIAMERNNLKTEIQELKGSIQKTSQTNGQERKVLEDQIGQIKTQHEEERSQLSQKHQQQIEELNLQIQEKDEQIADKDDIIKLHTDKNIKLTNQLKDLQKQHSADAKNTMQQYQEEMQELQDQHQNAMQTLRQEHTESLEVKQFEIKVLNQEKATLVEKNKTFEALLEQANSNAGDMSSKMAAELAKVKGELNKARAGEAELNQRVESLEGELSIATSENGDYASKIAEMEGDNGRLQDRIQELLDEIEDQRRSNSESENDQLRNMTQRIAQAEQKATQVKEELKTKNAELEAKIKEVDAQGRDLEQLYTQIEEKEQAWAAEKEEFEAQITELDAQLKERLQYQENYLEGKVEEIMKEAIEVRKAAIHEREQRENILSTSLIIQENAVDEVIADIGSNSLQLCKRVKYLEKVWFLVAQGTSYSWIDQDKVPMDKLKLLKVNDSVEQSVTPSELIQKKLEEIILEKESISNMLMSQKNKTITTPRSVQSINLEQPSENASFMHLKQMELDTQSLKVELLEEKRENASLKQVVLQLQQKVSDLGDVIIKLTSSGGAEDETLNNLINQKQDYKNRYHEQVDLNSKMELENEALRKQIAELSDISFARNFQSQAPGVLPGSAPNNNNLNDLLNASSIMDEDEKIDINIATENEHILQEKVAALEQELEEYKHELDRMKGENQDLKLTNTSQEMQKRGDDEVLENFRHIKPLFIQFLEGTPMSKKEDLLPVIFSMLQIGKDDVNKIKKNREQLTLASVKDGTKKGMLGLFGKK